MVRIRVPVPVMAAAATMTLAACSSINSVYPPPAENAAAFAALFPPPPPPVPAEAPAAATSSAMERELAELYAGLTQLSTRIDESRRHLVRLQAEVERTRAHIDRLLAKRQIAAPATASPADRVPVPPEERRPLVRIRFDHPDVEYDDALREAVSATLTRLPDAAFDLLAVSPATDGEGAAQDSGAGELAPLYAEEVMAVLVHMGIDPDRLSLSRATSGVVNADEVLLYIR